MELGDIFARDAVIPQLRAASKKQVLQAIAEEMAPASGHDVRTVFDVLLERERLGSTGVGNGVAIPHGKLPGMGGIVGLFVRVEKPVEFEAMDEQPVDLVFGLLAPEGSGAEHLKALSRIARVVRDQDLLAKLRAVSDADTLRALLIQPTVTAAA